MKALSIKQPYAELILNGKKKIELRKWKTKFRGEFLIHAPKIPDKEAMNKFGFSGLPGGFIVGRANLIGVKIYNNEEEHKKDRNLHLASSSWGRYGFILDDVKRVSPVPCSGKLNFFEFTGKT